jgi:RecG-like helicase
MPPTSDPDSALLLLTAEQYAVALEIIREVLHGTHQLMFLQGSAGTGKTFTGKILINALHSLGKSV